MYTKYPITWTVDALRSMSACYATTIINKETGATRFDGELQRNSLQKRQWIYLQDILLAAIPLGDLKMFLLEHAGYTEEQKGHILRELLAFATNRYEMRGMARECGWDEHIFEESLEMYLAVLFSRGRSPQAMLTLARFSNQIEAFQIMQDRLQPA